MILDAALSRRVLPICPGPKSMKSEEPGANKPKPPKDVPPVGITNSSSEESLRRLRYPRVRSERVAKKHSDKNLLSPKIYVRDFGEIPSH